jgi:hypothetical protein
VGALAAEHVVAARIELFPQRFDPAEIGPIVRSEGTEVVSESGNT